MIRRFRASQGSHAGVFFPDPAAPLLGTGVLSGTVPKLFPDAGLRPRFLAEVLVSPSALRLDADPSGASGMGVPTIPESA